MKTNWASGFFDISFTRFLEKSRPGVSNINFDSLLLKPLTVFLNVKKVLLMKTDNFKHLRR